MSGEQVVTPHESLGDQFEQEENWFAIRVKSNFERVSSLSLSRKGYETFLPTYQCRKRRWDRVVDQEVALFPSYIFCRFDFQCRLPILMTPGVMHIVGRHVPAPVPDEEILAVRRFIESGIGAERWPFLKVGQHVRITAGPLTGVEGILVSAKGHQRLVVSISLLQRSVAAVIDSAWVQPLAKPAASAGEASRYAAAYG